MATAATFIPKSFNILASFNLSQFLSIVCFPPLTPIPNVCIPAEIPTAQTSCVIELYDGADADGGEDFIFEFVVLLVVDVDSEPDSYVVVVVDSYPPSIDVLDPEVFVCVVSA
jgi:hypothetical protein